MQAEPKQQKKFKVLLSPQLLKTANKKHKELINLNKRKLEIISEEKNRYIVKFNSEYLIVNKSTLKIEKKLEKNEDQIIVSLITIKDHVYSLSRKKSKQNISKEMLKNRYILFKRSTDYTEEFHYCENNPSKKMFIFSSYFDKKRSFYFQNNRNIAIFTESVKQRRIPICLRTKKILGKLPLVNLNNRINLTVYQFFFKLFNLIQNHEDQLFHDGDYKKQKVREFKGNFFNFGNYDTKWCYRFQGVISNNFRFINHELLEYFNIKSQDVFIRKLSCFFRFKMDIIVIFVAKNTKGDEFHEDSFYEEIRIFERLDNYNQVSTKELSRATFGKREVDSTQFYDGGRFLRVELKDEGEEKIDSQEEILEGVNFRKISTEKEKKSFFEYFYLTPNFDFIKIGEMDIKDPRLIGFEKGNLIFRGMKEIEEHGGDSYFEVSFKFPHPHFVDENGFLI